MSRRYDGTPPPVVSRCYSKPAAVSPSAGGGLLAPTRPDGRRMRPGRAAHPAGGRERVALGGEAGSLGVGEVEVGGGGRWPRAARPSWLRGWRRRWVGGSPRPGPPGPRGPVGGVAISRRAVSSGWARSRLPGRNNRVVVARTPGGGLGCRRRSDTPSSPLGQRAVGGSRSAQLAWAQGTRSMSGLRATRLYCTWLVSTRPPSIPLRQAATARGLKLLTPTWVDQADLLQAAHGGAWPAGWGNSGLGQCNLVEVHRRHAEPGRRTRRPATPPPGRSARSGNTLEATNTCSRLRREWPRRRSARRPPCRRSPRCVDQVDPEVEGPVEDRRPPSCVRDSGP